MHESNSPLPRVTDGGQVLRDYLRGMRNLDREHGFETLRVEGQLPADLHGTLYLSGPALFSLFGRPYQHWFDGDGAITAVCFAATQAKGAVRLVESRELKEERMAGRAIYTSGSTLAPQWWRRPGVKFKNVANIKPLYWNQRLFALFEAGLPTEIHPDSLETIGETNLNGSIQGFFSAHFHQIPSRRAAYNFSIKRGAVNHIHLYELPTDGPIRCIGKVPVPKSSAMLHDFIATENHLIFFIPPVRLSVLPLLLGLKAPLETMRWCPQDGTTVLVIPIDAPAQYKSFKTAPFFLYHFMNAYEVGHEIVVDFVHVSEFEASFKSHAGAKGPKQYATNGRLYRATVQADRAGMQLEQRWAQPCEFPAVAPAVQGSKHRFGYVLGSKADEPQTMICKLDMDQNLSLGEVEGSVQSVILGPRQFPSEAVFVPRAGATQEDDGYLLVFAYDAELDKSFIAVLDAQDIRKGPLARAWFDHHIPRPLHATWRDQNLPA